MDEMKNESELENEETLVPEAGSEENAAPEVQPEAPEAAPEEKTEPKPGLSAGKIALLVVLAVAAIAIVIALIVNGTRNQVPSGEAEGAKPTAQATEPVETTEPTIPADGNPDDVTCKGTYYVEDADLEAALDTVIATAGGQELTNRQLQVYYWMSFYDFLDMYGNYITALGMDPTANLDMQKSIQEGQTCSSSCSAVRWRTGATTPRSVWKHRPTPSPWTRRLPNSSKSSPRSWRRMPKRADLSPLRP